MAVIYKLMDHAERIGEWDDLRTAATGVQAYLTEHRGTLDALQLIGFLTTYERGAAPAFAVSGPDIPAYLKAACTVLASDTEADDTARAVARLPSPQRQAFLDLLRPAERRRVQALLEHAQ